MENLTDDKLLIVGKRLNKQYCPPFGNRIYMSHPESKRQICQQYRRSKTNQNFEIPEKQESSELNKLKISYRNATDSSTQTSKTILQLAELEEGYLSPDSLSSPKKHLRHQQNRNSKKANMPYMRKKSVENFFYQCCDGEKQSNGENFSPRCMGSLTNTFLTKKRKEDAYPIYECRSQFLQQTSPLRNLPSCTSDNDFKSKSFCSPHSSAYYASKKNYLPLSRFTVNNVRNQQIVDNMDPLVFWHAETNKEQVIKPMQKELLKKLYIKKHGSSYMSPTIASEQRNQQHLVKAFDRLMSPTKRGRSLSPIRIMCSLNNSKEKSFINDKHKPFKCHYDGSKSYSLLSDYTFDDNQLKSDVSRLNLASPKMKSSTISSTASTENLILQIMNRVKDNDWSISLKGLAEVADCCRSMDTDLLHPHMTTINQKLLKLLRSPRSHVCRTACQIAGHLFETMKDTRRPEFDDIVDFLLAKTADSNKFIRRDANLSLDCMVTHIPIFHAVRSLCSKGPVHKNPLVRTATLRLIVCAVVIAGPDIILNLPGHEATRKRIVHLFPSFLLDKHLETRKYGERLFAIFAKEESFEYHLKKYLDPNDILRINRVLKCRHLKR